LSSRRLLLALILTGATACDRGPAPVADSGAAPAAPDPADRVAALWDGLTVYSLQLHAHGAVSEGTATPASAVVQAEGQGVDVIWWTDHDTFYHPQGMFQATSFDFESGMSQEYRLWPLTETMTIGWEYELGDAVEADFVADPAAARTGSYGGRMLAHGTSRWTDETWSWRLWTQRRSNFMSLLGEVALDISLRPTFADGDVEVQVIIPLSATDLSEGSGGLDAGERRLVLYWNTTGATHTDLDDGVSLYQALDLTEGAWSDLSVDLTTMAVAGYGDDAYGLHAEPLIVRETVANGATIVLDMDDLDWRGTVEGQELRAAHRSYLRSMGASVVQHVGLEVSPLDAGHFGAFGSSVPFLDYARDSLLTATDASDRAHDVGGITAWNHIFGVRLVEEDAATRAALVDAAVSTMLAESGHHVDMMEVGYRQRHGLLEDFLSVWDQVAEGGLILTGIGTSDLHDDKDWDTWINRFVTWVPASNAGEDALIRALAAGQAWFGDPTLFAGGDCVLQLEVPALGMTMGQGAIGVSGTQTATFAADWLDAGWEVRAVENGATVASWTVDTAGAWSTTHDFDPSGGLTLRFEVWNGTEGAVFTNPLYFRDTDDGSIPRHRQLR